MDSCTHLANYIEAVNLSQLPPLTTLLVWTWNSLYRVVVVEGSTVYVQGGAFFPDPTVAQLDGASWGGGLLLTGCIGVGLVMELQTGGTRFMTSPVLAIARERSESGAVH